MSVVVGLLTENTLPMLVQATRLLRSIRWFGGDLAGARVVICGVGELERQARQELEALGAEMRTVSRFHPANPTANRHQLLSELLDAPEELLLLLDCDTLVVQDPLRHLSTTVFQAKIAPAPTVTDEVFERLFTHFKLPKPPRSHVTPFTGTPTIPYFNAGVLAIPTVLAGALAPAWRKYNLALANHPELVAPCQRHMHQASLSLALAETAIPYAELPEALNYQINTSHLMPAERLAEIDPVIIHYHQLATDDGFLLDCPYPRAQRRIDQFHDRLLAQGSVREPSVPVAGDSRPVVVLGMHRSGTSLVAQVISALGSYAGPPDALIPPDLFNPTGYWEYREAVLLDREIMAELSTSLRDVLRADVARLRDDQRAGYVGRAREIARSLEGHGSFVLKDPRIALLFPIWREALGDPVCVIAWRDPMAVARSLATRDKEPALIAIALWEHYNRTLLRDSEGLRRVLVSYEDLLAEPALVTNELHAALTAFGVPGLVVPSEERLRQLVQPDFNRSGQEGVPRSSGGTATSSEESLLDADQKALLAALRSGAVLREPAAPTSPRTRELLELYAKLEHRDRPLRERIVELDLLLKGVFDSRSWRIGHRLTAPLRRRDAVSAVDRWRALMRKPL